MKTTRALLVAALTAATVVLAGCASGNDPLDSGGDLTSSADPTAIVVGSQAYYSNEIIAEIYAQALEADGFTVDRKFNIGQRDAYMPALESGTVSLFPEYTGNLLQWFDKEATATESEAVYEALTAALPDGLTALDQAPATDQDSYTVTRKLADQYGLKTIADLAKVPGVTLGGAAELQTRPYGPAGLKSVYGVDVAFEPTADTTVDELIAGNIQVADVYTADPRIITDDLVTLEDPKSLFLASHVVPIASTSVAGEIAEVVNAVSAELTDDVLRDLNLQSTRDQKSPEDIATAWLESAGLSK